MTTNEKGRNQETYFQLIKFFTSILGSKSRVLLTKSTLLLVTMNRMVESEVLSGGKVIKVALKHDFMSVFKPSKSDLDGFLVRKDGETSFGSCANLRSPGFSNTIQ